MGHADHSVQGRYRHPNLIAEDAGRLNELLAGVASGTFIPLTGAHAGAQEPQAASLSQTG
jgi:hypothetical protein